MTGEVTDAFSGVSRGCDGGSRASGLEGGWIGGQLDWWTAGLVGGAASAIMGNSIRKRVLLLHGEQDDIDSNPGGVLANVPATLQ